MIIENNIYGFGLFKGMGYTDRDGKTESFEEYLHYHNRLSKHSVIQYIKSLPISVAGFPVKDIFSGKDDGIGALYEDGPFTFPVQFLRYYETYDIGIPPEYEDYLINVVGLK